MSDVETLQTQKMETIMRILNLANDVLSDVKGDERQKQRWSRIAIEAINALGKMKDVGRTKDDLANLLAMLQKSGEMENERAKNTGSTKPFSE